jgi:hypothetical protein
VAEPASIAARDVLAQQLDCFSMAALQQMARNLGLKQTPKQRIPLLNALCNVIGSPAHLRILEVRLSPLQRSLLEILPVRLGEFTLQPLRAILIERGINGQPALDALQGLFAHGCLLPTQPVFGTQKLGLNLGEYNFIGHHLQYRLAPTLVQWIREHPSIDPRFPAADPPPAVHSSSLLELQRALLVTTSELSRRPLRLTTTGLLNRTDLARLVKALAVASGQPAPKGASPPIPALLWFAIAIARAAGLLCEVQDSQLETDESAAEFYRQPIEQQLRALFNAWIDCQCHELAFVSTLTTLWGSVAEPWVTERRESLYGTPHLDRLRTARSVVFTALIEGIQAEPDRWYAVEDLARAVMSHYPEILFTRTPYDPYYGFSPYSFGFGGGRQQPRPYPGLYRAPAPGSDRPVMSPERQLFMETDWLEVEGAYVRQLVGESMRWLGLVEVDQPPPGQPPTRFHLTDLGLHLFFNRPLSDTATEVAPGHAIVQPNFEVVIPDAASSLGLIAQLDSFAERRTLDRAAIYVLTPEALVRGLDQSWTGDRILQTLESAAGSPLPQNVRFSLEEWVARYEAVSVHEAGSLLEADSPEQLDGWLADRKLAPMLGRRLGPRTILIPARHHDLAVNRIAGISSSLRRVDYAHPPTGVLTLHDPDRLAVPPAHAEPYLDHRLRTFADPYVIPSEAKDPSSVTPPGVSGAPPLKELLPLPAGERVGEKGVAPSEEETVGPEDPEPEAPPLPANAVLYHLTQASVTRAAASGLTSTAILDFLALAAGQPVPTDMRVRILGWGNAISAYSAESIVAVSLPTESPNWLELRKIPALRRLLRAVPTKELALVPADKLDVLVEALRERGIEVRRRQVSVHLAADDPYTNLRTAFEAFGRPEVAAEHVQNWADAELRKQNRQNRRYGW